MRTKPQRKLRTDERGAILVVGLLGCILLVGVLWTLIGVGDIAAFRARGQDAADSGAYSAALMMARGMNTIVLFNVIMSFVLAVRVVLKVMQFAVLAAAIVCFATIILIPVGVALLGLVSVIQELITAVNPPINLALQGLNLAANGVQMVIPSFAKGTANYVAKQYAPLVKSLTVASPYAEPPDILVSPPSLREDQFGDLPCEKAGRATVALFSWFIEKIVPGDFVKAVRGRLQDAIGGLMGNPVTALYFCELGVNLHPPDTPDLDAAVDGISKDCMKKLGWEDRDLVQQPLDYGERQKLKLCTQPTTDALEAAKDTAAEAASGALNAAKVINSPPTLNLDGWQNGDPSSHVIAVAVLEPSKPLRAARGVTVGGFGVKVGAPADETLVKAAFAESEIYYDCIGNWENDCKGRHEAMWNFAWRARLVSVDSEGS
ncbi:MAG TPA: hypothetical protein VIV60_06475, partial [Polyangiaceae bacterium]